MNETLVEGRYVTEVVSISVFLSIIICTSIFGNLAVIFAICNDYKLREEVSNIFIINLAVTDLSNALIVMNLSLISVLDDKWRFGDILCSFVCCANYCFIIASMLTLCFISFDRYYAILKPLQYHIIATKRKILAATAYAWIQGVVFSLVPALLQWTNYNYWEAICAIQWFEERPGTIYYVVLAFIFCFLGPGLLLIKNYLGIVKAVKQMTSTVDPDNLAHVLQADRKKRAKQNKHTQKSIRSLMVVVIAYFVCMTPFSVTKLVKVVISDVVPDRVNTAASLIGYCSSALNPFIYAIFRHDFRRAYKNALFRILRRNAINSEQFSRNETA